MRFRPANTQSHFDFLLEKHTHAHMVRTTYPASGEDCAWTRQPQPPQSEAASGATVRVRPPKRLDSHVCTTSLSCGQKRYTEHRTHLSDRQTDRVVLVSPWYFGSVVTSVSSILSFSGMTEMVNYVRCEIDSDRGVPRGKLPQFVPASRKTQLVRLAAISWVKLRNRARFEGKLTKFSVELISCSVVFMKYSLHNFPRHSIWRWQPSEACYTGQ
jgi:hypothetical protein